jgi:hypothetical protein
MIALPGLVASLAVLVPVLLLGTATSGQNPPPGGGLSVVSIDPAPHSVGISPVSPLLVRFSQPLDLDSLNADSIQVYGRWSGVMDGTLEPLGDGQLLLMRPAWPYQPGEQLTVTFSSGVTSTTGARLLGGFSANFWVAPAEGQGTFALEGVLSTRLEGEGLVQSYGIYAGDLDGDGAPDFSIPNETANDVRVLLNDGCGRYGDLDVYPLPAPSTPSANEGQDFDGDGDIDLAVANIEGDSMSVLRGDGAGGYLPPETVAAGDTPRALVTFDVEGDGDPDIITANRYSSDLCLFRNDGTGAFALPVLFEGGGDGETALAATDADNDGRVDLFVGHHLSASATILLNDGTGAFAVSDSAAVGDGPWMATAGDLTGDGFVDFATVDAWSNTLSVLLGDGAGGLSPGPVHPTGFWPIAVDFGDVEGDGDLDIVTSAISGGIWRLFWNDGSGSFPVTEDIPGGTVSSCATLVDDDRDGLLDIIGIDEVADEISLWRQVGGAPPGVQTASCEATLRLDAFALAAGFGGQRPHDLVPGEVLHIGVSGEPGATFGVLIGPPREPGLPSPFGLFNLAEPFAQVLGGVLDDDGEALLTVPLAPDLAPGLVACVQAYVGAPGAWTLSNPELGEVVP